MVTVQSNKFSEAKSHHFGMLFSEVHEESRVTVFRIRIGFNADADLVF